MEQLIWTVEKLVPFVRHPDMWVRQWAVERLIKLFPNEAGDYLEAVLDDDHSYIVLKAADFYAKLGETRYSPVILKHLKKAKGDRFGYLAAALGELGEHQALPLLLKRVRQAFAGERPFEQGEFLRVAGAMGRLCDEEARQMLWELLDVLPPNEFAVQSLMGALLRCIGPGDVKELIKRYRSMPWDRQALFVLNGFASILDEVRLVQEVVMRSDDLDDALNMAENWLGCTPDISDECYESLEAVFTGGYEGVFPVLLNEAQRILAERGDDLAAWRAEWEQGRLPEGYPRFALYLPVLFEAFIELPSEDPDQRRAESAFGLALLCALSVHRNDEKILDSATDSTEAMLGILADCREHVLPDIVDRVVTLGPEIAPKLAGLLDPENTDWGLMRVAQAIEKLARAYPGSCDVCVPGLVALVNEERGDYFLEACNETLPAIGPPAVDDIARHLRDPDITRQIYLTGALGDIPTESSADALLSVMSEQEEPDEGFYIALMEVGSASAIEPLYQKWLEIADLEPSGKDWQLIETLLILCVVHGVKKPELSLWRRILKEHEIRMEQISRSLFQEPEEIEEPEPERMPLLPPKKRSVRSTKKVSKQEKKKRAANRKANKKKKR